MKRFLSFALALAVVVTAFSAVSVSAATFPDVSGDHWAYSAIVRLVNDGTVNGLPNGTFNPNGVVSRAEFVKMLGMDSNMTKYIYRDVATSHWAYDYIIHSGMEPDRFGNFNPGQAITRSEAVNLLYKRFAGGKKATVPYYIWQDSSNSVAVAWAYNTGLMIGADRLNLRLKDSLTRAEAASLIVRAKDLDPSKQTDFINNFSDETYKNVYEGLDIFNTPYNADEGMTYEELSVAAIRYQYKQRNPALVYTFEKMYDGEFAHFFNIMCRNPLDQKKYGSTKEEAEKLVTVEDAIAMITYGARRNDYIISNMVKPNGQIYGEVTAKVGTQFEEVMSYAYNFGISLYADAKINAKKTITKKEISCIFMQYGLSFGDHILLRCGYNSEYIPTMLRRSSASYPKNAGMYRYILEEIPNSIYDAPYKLKNEILYTPKQFEPTAFLHAKMFYTPLIYISANAYDKGADIYIDYHPSLMLSVKDCGEIYRVRIDVKRAFDGMKLSDIVKLGDGVQDITLTTGDSFWCDLATNAVRMSTYIDYELFTVENVIKQ